MVEHVSVVDSSETRLSETPGAPILEPPGEETTSYIFIYL